MSTPIAGILNSINSDNVNDNVGEWMTGIIVKQARGDNQGLLLALTSLLGTEPAESPDYNWFVRNPVRRSVHSAAAEADTAETTLTFDDADGNNVNAFLTSGTLLENRRTGEHVRVAADSTGSTASVVRAQGDTAAAAIDDNDVWLIVGYAGEEGTGARRAIFEIADPVKNYLQEFKATSDVTRLLAGSNLRSTEDQRLEGQAYALETLSNDIEFAMFNGRRGASVGANGGRIYTTGGLRDGISRAGLAASNSLAGGGSSGTELTPFIQFLSNALEKGGSERIAFCGPKAYSAISLYANSGVAGFEITGSETEFGMHIKTIETPMGPVHLVRHPLFANDEATKGDMFIVDLTSIKQKVGQPIVLEEDIQIPGYTKATDQYIAQLGIKQKFAEPFGYVSNLEKIIPDA